MTCMFLDFFYADLYCTEIWFEFQELYTLYKNRYILIIMIVILDNSH